MACKRGSGWKHSYSHINLAQVAMAVFNHVSVFGSVEGWHWTSAAFSADIEVGRVNGHGHQMDTQVTCEHNTCALNLRSGAHTHTSLDLFRLQRYLCAGDGLTKQLQTSFN